MFQWLYTYVANIYPKCFIYFRRMQMFYLDVAYVAVAIHICCKRMLQTFHLFQTYVAEVLHVATLTNAGSYACGGGPRVCAEAKRAWVVSTCMRSSMGTQHHAYAQQHARAGRAGAIVAAACRACGTACGMGPTGEAGVGLLRTSEC
jgi:hypothetical protein